MSFAQLPNPAQTRAIELSIAADEARIVALQTELEFLRRRVATHRYYIAPIRKLPWELLAQVFAIAIADSSNPLLVLALGRVCCSFRHATLVAPALWATFSIDVAAPGRKPTQLTRIFLKNSGALPLDITLPLPAIQKEKANAYRSTTINVIKMIQRHQVRLKSFAFHVDAFETAQAAVSLMKGPAPILEKLHIGVACEFSSDQEQLRAFETAFNPAPVLRELKLQHCSLPLSPAMNDNFPFSSVTTLSLGHFKSSFDHMKSIFDQMPNLGTLSIIHWVDLQDRVADILLPNLHTLTVIDHLGSGYGVSFLSAITTPNLRHLSLESFLEALPESFDDADFNDELLQRAIRVDLIGEIVREFFTRSAFPQLESFFLADSEMAPSEFIHIMREMTKLRSLTLIGMSVPMSLYRDLAARPGPRSSRRPTLPQLRELVIGHTDVKFNMLAKAIKTRNLTEGMPYAPLERLSLDHCSGGGPDRARLPFMDPSRLKVTDNGPACHMHSLPSVNPMAHFLHQSFPMIF